MNKNWMIAIIVIVAVALAGWYFVAGQQSVSEQTMMKQDDSSIGSEQDTVMQENPSEESMMKEDPSASSGQNTMMEDKDKMMENSNN